MLIYTDKLTKIINMESRENLSLMLNRIVLYTFVSMNTLFDFDVERKMSEIICN